MLVANDRSNIPAPPGVSAEIKYTFSNEKLSRYSTLTSYVYLNLLLMMSMSMTLWIALQISVII